MIGAQLKRRQSWTLLSLIMGNFRPIKKISRPCSQTSYPKPATLNPLIAGGKIGTVQLLISNNNAYSQRKSKPQDDVMEADFSDKDAMVMTMNSIQLVQSQIKVSLDQLKGSVFTKRKGKNFIQILQILAKPLYR